MSRREFVDLAGMSAAALAAGTVASDRVLARPVWQGDPFSLGNPFSLGVASGDPLPDGVVLWTRLAPDPVSEDGAGGMPGRRGARTVGGR